MPPAMSQDDPWKWLGSAKRDFQPP